MMIRSSRSKTSERLANKKESSPNVGKNNNQLKNESPSTRSPSKRLKPSFSNPSHNEKYNTLAEIIGSVSKDTPSVKVNTVCVVHQILKPLCTTPDKKFKVIIEVVDSTLTKNDSIPVIHFFTKEDSILKQISQGDVLRLQNVKMKLIFSDIHGKVYNSNDITLFKRKSSASISLAKNTVVTEIENKKVEELKTWFEQKHMSFLLSKVALISDIINDGNCKLLCKIVEDPYECDGCLRVPVTDGTTTKSLSPAFPLVAGSELPLVTEITVRLQPGSQICVQAQCQAYQTIMKSNSYILFNKVDVMKTYCLTLEVNTKGRNKFVVISGDNEGALEIERRIGSYIKETETPTKQSALKRNFTGSKTSPEIQERVEDDVETVSKKSRTETKKKSTAGQRRRTLFTANCADWSDATEEVSENSPPTLGEVREKDPPVEASSPLPVLNCPSQELTKPPAKSNDPIDSMEIEEAWDKNNEIHIDRLKYLLGVVEDRHSLIHNPIIRVSVFVDGILPNPEGDHYDLVSGVCEGGCGNAFLFSVISWTKKGADSEILPTCPACDKVGRPSNLRLMFLFELDVFDMDGKCGRLLVTREHAEQFLNCSVEEYLKDQSKRERCVRSLKALTRKSEPKNRRTKRPKLVASVVCVKNLYCLVCTRFDFSSFMQHAVDQVKS